MVSCGKTRTVDRNSTGSVFIPNNSPVQLDQKKFSVLDVSPLYQKDHNFTADFYIEKENTSNVLHYSAVSI